MRKSLRVSMADGMFASFMIGVVEAYFVPFGLALQATASQIGQLTAIPNLIGALTQSQANTLTSLVGGRKRALRVVVLLQAFVLLLLPLFIRMPASARFPGLLGAVICYMVFSGLASPLWGSMMSEYLPSSRRSGYFGWRNRWVGLVQAGSSLLAGALLSHFARASLRGFAILFFLGGTARLISWALMSRMEEVGFQERRRVPRPRAPQAPFDRNFVRFVVFCGLLGGSINLAAPFFPVYLLNIRHFSYFTYTVLVVAAQAAMFYAMARWGWKADQAGNFKVIRLVSWAMPLISLSWMVPGNGVYFFVVQALSGLVWAGYNLCTTNYIYDALPSEQRIRGTVLFNMVNGFSSFATAWIGGQLMETLPPIAGERFFTLALLSTVLRVVVLISLLPGIREVREVTQMRSLDLFYSMIGVRPMLALIRNTTRFGVREEM